MDRRQFIQTGFLGSLFLTGNTLTANSPLRSEGFNIGPRARNIIFLVSDGMSIGTLGFTDQFIRWRDGRPSNWMRLYEEGIVRRGLVDTASANSIVTDSGAASTAWGSGRRVPNNAINIDADGVHYQPILPRAKEAGKATGIITTATATHATPAGFVANVMHRRGQAAIAEQYLAHRIDFIAGGGREFFDKETREDRLDLTGQFKAAGYDIVRTRNELNHVASSGRPLLALFGEGALPYEIDRQHDPVLQKRIPPLSELTRIALNRLSAHPEGFVLQVEGGRVDHGAHQNDIGALIYDQIEFDETIAVAMDFAERSGDTLVIITTDHGNANPGLSSGRDGGSNTFETLKHFRGSHEPILSQIHRRSSNSHIADVIEEVTGIRILRKNAELLRLRLLERYRLPYERMNGLSGVLGQLLANHTDIGWIGNAHTSDPVELAAFGPGSEGVRAFQKNTDVFHLMISALGLPSSPTARR